MNGAIAAGSQATARAGAEILRAGGNAVDAAVGACFAVAAGEPTLTSLAGAGALLYRSESGQMEVCDFFADAPGLGVDPPEEMNFYGVDLDFGPTVQCFYIGAAAAAVPGAIPGLCTALERWGSMPLDRVIEPACRMLREGMELGKFQAGAMALLGPILIQSETGKKIFTPRGRLMRAGETFRHPALADTLERLASEGWRTHYEAVIWRDMLDQFGPGSGGLLGQRDLSEYEIKFREPLALDYRGGHRLVTNPPPAQGGHMIATMLGLLETEDLGSLEPSGLELNHALCRAMKVADEMRLAGDELSDAWRARFAGLAGKPLGNTPTVDGGPGSTTHVSVIDATGCAAAVTFSYGEGNGAFIGHSGIMMNNLMGEDDLFPDGFHTWDPGTRLSTMVSPSVLVSPAGDVTVLGSGGANRIRTAMTQVIELLVDHGHSLRRAVRAARVHFEAGVLNAEIFDMADGGAALAKLGAPELVNFPEPNLFFGGVHTVRLGADGTLEAAGDPRRGGVGIVVRDS